MNKKHSDILDKQEYLLGIAFDIEKDDVKRQKGMLRNNRKMQDENKKIFRSFSKFLEQMEKNNINNKTDKIKLKIYNKKVKEAKEENAKIAFRKLRKEILSRGCGGMISLGRLFKLLDENNSKTLDYDEFCNALKEFKINLSKDEITDLFNTFDKNGNGLIEYEEFLNQIRGPMNQKRKDIVTKAFNKAILLASSFIHSSCSFL